jgi:hypothetical protein
MSCRPAAVLVAGVLAISLGTPALAQLFAPPAPPTQRIILSLGSDQFIPKATIEGATEARFQSDLRGLKFLDQVSVIILADLPFNSLDPFLQNEIPHWVSLGGSLLVTGGNRSFGLGGYVGTSIGSILPLLPDPRDKTVHSFGPPLPIDQNHPALAGVSLVSMAVFNETQLAGDAALILQYRAGSKGGASGGGMTGSGRTFVTTVNPKTGQPQVTLGTPAQSQAGQVTNPVTGQTLAVGPGSGTVSSGAGGVGQSGVFPGANSTGQTFDPGFGTEGGLQGGGGGLLWPLLAERHLGAGTILATSLDMNGTGEWKDRDNFVINMVQYLVRQSKLPRAQ